MSADHEDLVQALVARGHDQGNVSTRLKGLEAKGLVTITRTPGGQAEAVDLTAEGRKQVAALAASCDKVKILMTFHRFATMQAVLLYRPSPRAGGTGEHFARTTSQRAGRVCGEARQITMAQTRTGTDAALARVETLSRCLEAHAWRWRKQAP